MNFIFLVISSLIIVPIIFSIINYKYFSKSLKTITYLLWISFIFNILDIMIVYFLKKSSLPMFHIYTIIEFIFLSYYFYFLTERKYFKKIILFLIPVFLGIVILIKMFFEPITKIDSYTLTIECIFLLIFSSIYLTEYLSENLIIKLSDYRFLLTIGFMIYYGGNLFVFALSNEFDVWLIHNVLIILLWSIYTITFIWQRYQAKSGG